MGINRGLLMTDKRKEALEWFNAMYDWYDEQILTDPRFCSEEEWEASKPIVETIRAALSEPVNLSDLNELSESNYQLLCDNNHLEKELKEVGLDRDPVTGRFISRD